MKKHFSSAVCMAALLLVAGVSADAHFSSAMAQEVQVDFGTFHDQLAPYGDWVYSDRWGEVWIPTDVSDDFHPYGTAGHWVYTSDYGWTWASDYEWGDIPFHYGRWVNDPDDGWMWIPGYVWSPGWVVWRHNGQYTGWMPAPPDDQFLGRRSPGVSFGINIGGVSISFGNDQNDDYGYSRWYGRDYGADRYAQNWVFVGTGHMADRDFRRYEAPRNNYTTIIHNTTNITNYTVVNNYVVNKSVDPRAVQRAGGHVQTVKAAAVFRRPQFITRADMGVQVQERARTDRPRGTGFANSAPKPSAFVVQSLSTKRPQRHGGPGQMHLFTRDTVGKAPLQPSTANTAGPGTSPLGKEDHMKARGPGMGPAMSGPAMTGPAMTGPANQKTKKGKHNRVITPMTTGPGMMGPSMTGPAAPKETKPAAATIEPKHGKRDRMIVPNMSGPAMSAPGAEIKHGKRKKEMPGMTGPAVTAPANPPPPKHENRAPAPRLENPKAPPPHPKGGDEPHKKHGKPENATQPR